MSLKECCQTCKHCICGQNSSSYGWCLLRKIKVHPDIAQLAFCHHWSTKEPILPNLAERERDLQSDTQLDFSQAFSILNN
ncbi:hypothetical protein [Prochlorococcus marinus]|uniref:Metal-binding cluster containing protein n=1 Tax=Prochlorococcus marinus (strain MIT 9211) TaxID=93059 RepID=A9BDD6_PROM4|nr:hypothetical protein [Prochlorococcus marinus]ABX09749.1 Hypothetical protein P9211_18181 [Prochlorococcus marinus str. MIT 9211]